MKYELWNVSEYDPMQQKALCAAGFSSLTAAVLCSRGYTDPSAARDYLAADAPLCDPFKMKDMDKAVARVRRALEEKEHIAVFGDYDVDGITATCLLTDFLRSCGGKVTSYIPARMEEGYGLNALALQTLKEQGVQLVITVDCGITASEEAELCRTLGMELIITDHHECKEDLPDAVAVIDPHRKDRTYPHQMLAGVGVAFKLAAAICEDQQAVLDRYAHLACLGTVADVMPLQGENRTIVAKGLKKLTENPCPGVAALMKECSVEGHAVTANLIGYTLAPRINAAGRMGKVDVAVELFLTKNPDLAAELAEKLCRMNRQRQSIELEIYQDAVSRLPKKNPSAIVLSGEDWHQGVVGIVASRLAEEYSCPTFLICMDGEKGKASSRSYGGFNLFKSLDELSPLLESYGGHELAAGFTICRDRIDAFREEMEKRAEAFRLSGDCKSALEIDCEVSPDMLTIADVDALEQLEPCGAGCPKPLLCMTDLKVEQLTAVGGGKHLRLRLSKNGRAFNAIFFSTTALGASVAEGDYVEVAFAPQINEFRGARSVQLNLVDIRQNPTFREEAAAGAAIYADLQAGETLTAAQAAQALPERREFAVLWKYLIAHAQDGSLEECPERLARQISRNADIPLSPLKLQICLDALEELGLLHTEQKGKSLVIMPDDCGQKVNLEDSRLLQKLRQMQAGE